MSPSGKILLNHVNKIFTEIENAIMEIESQDYENVHTIKISISNSRFLSGLISEYISLYPDTKIQQNLGINSEILTSLKKGDIDLGITCIPILDEDIESCVLIEEDIVLVLPSCHKLAGKAEIYLSEVAHDPFISLANNKEYNNFITALCKRIGFIPINNYEVDSILLSEVIKLDQGVALLPVSVCRKFNLNYVKITDIGFTITANLFWLRNGCLSSTAKNFQDFIISYFKNNSEMFKVH